MRFAALAVALLTVPLAHAGAQQRSMIADPATNCATSNPFPKGNERITWTGGCQNGLLEGKGVLTWYRGDEMTERNEAVFRNGEMQGEATTSFPDGSSVVGNYDQGRRNGEFVVVRPDGRYIRAIYRNDRLVSERELSRRQVRALIEERRNQPPQQTARAAEPPAPVAVPAPVYAPPAPAAIQTAPVAAPPPAPAPPSTAIAAAPQAAPQYSAAPPMAAPAPSAYTPPWSPTANAAALTGRTALAAAPQPRYPAPAPSYTRPATAQPAYAPPPYQPSVYSAPAAQAVYNPYVAQPAYAAPAQPPVAAPPVATPVVAAPVPIAAVPPAVAQPAAVAAPQSMVARRLCTAPGLYPNNAGWCGIVRNEQPGEVQLEVTEVRVNSLFAIGISPGECTGNEFISSGSKGSRVWVPARCMR